MIKLITLVGLSIISAHSGAASVLIDDFTIIKNDNVLFQDAFDNDIAPDDTGGNTQSYRVFGGSLGPEQGGKLILNADLGESVSRPDAGDMSRQGARVLTNTNPDRPNRGLRTDDTFSVTGLFDLTTLLNVRERYGVRLTDGGFTGANDSLGLSVMRTSPSQLDVVFHSYDQTAFTFFDIESISLDSDHDQVALTLSRLDTTNNNIIASFAYVDDGVIGNYTAFTSTDTIFNGEDFTRAQFMHVAPVPIPVAFWLFGSGILGLIGVARRSSCV